LNTYYSNNTLNKYRFGFNGKENDKEVNGQQDYGMRIYDNRLGRFKSLDPLQTKFPFFSPYHFAGNSPIANIDLDGLEPQLAIDKWSKSKGFVNHGLYWKDQKCDGCDEWTMQTVVNDGDVYLVARKQISIFGKETFMWYYPSDPDAKWRSFNPTEYHDPQEYFLKTAETMGDFGKVMEGVFMGTIGLFSGTELGVFGAALYNASFEFIKQYGLSGGEMNKVDWANVAIEGAPLPKGMNALAGDIVKDLAQAAVDYSDGKFKIIGTENKTFTEAGIEAVSNMIATAVIGKYNEQIQGAFRDKDPKYTKPMVEQITKFATEYTKEIMSNGMVDKYKEKQATPKN
jgi:RHS repeat-associated protein